jgi:hypothetical protein
MTDVEISGQVDNFISLARSMGFQPDWVTANCRAEGVDDPHSFIRDVFAALPRPEPLMDDPTLSVFTPKTRQQLIDSCHQEMLFSDFFEEWTNAHFQLPMDPATQRSISDMAKYNRMTTEKISGADVRVFHLPMSRFVKDVDDGGELLTEVERSMAKKEDFIWIFHACPWDAAADILKNGFDTFYSTRHQDFSDADGHYFHESFEGALDWCGKRLSGRLSCWPNACILILEFVKERFRQLMSGPAFCGVKDNLKEWQAVIRAFRCRDDRPKRVYATKLIIYGQICANPAKVKQASADPIYKNQWNQICVRKEALDDLPRPVDVVAIIPPPTTLSFAFHYATSSSTSDTSASAAAAAAAASTDK